MSQSSRFYQQLDRALHQGAVVIATVASRRGSVPREVGAKMVVCQDGGTFGTVGGGAGEAKVLACSEEVLATGRNQWVEIDLSGSPDLETQGVCGGRMRVWLACWRGEEAIALVGHILALLQSGQSAVLVSPFDSDRRPYLHFPSHGEPVSPPSSQFPKQTIAIEEALLEPLQPPPTLLIVGGGHVGVAIASVAQIAGFEIVVQDDRPEFARPQRFVPGTTAFDCPLSRVLEILAALPQLYVALVTRSYQHDIEALSGLLLSSRSYRYIGAIGSRKRVQMVQQDLKSRGIPTAHLHSIYAPIGLDIGALTPEEIAVSVCAELILVRRGGTGLPLSRRYPHPGV